MIESHATSTESRQIRVFLSSTFVDFIEERELLVKRVFPALNRRARDRGVELIDVDLRWGVTEEQTKKGLTLPLCLGEIDRCRPYFIGLLGERHGWVPPADFYQPELLERQPWLRQHQGGASVTELEILHGVLRNPEMAGYARFYLRDPAYALAKKDPTWLAEGEEERQRLQALKEQVRASRFPVVEGLSDPEAIASRIEADLWELIEERFPEQEQPDALEQENRKHASYRHSRTSEGQYIGGEGYIEQLDGWLEESHQQILITGESGSGKSALIANWMHQHALEHPGDVVYAHHLGCSNDANAIRPLLGRMLDTASKLLKDAGLITEPIPVPADWWELTAKVAKTLQDLGRWCKATGHRWIWVLDGLNRLGAEDQQALPWLPLLIPEGVSVVISALECQARTILEERQFRRLTIGPLQRPEQQTLIERYLERYAKKLEPERRHQILNCELAGSPLFLKVLLEELRQCGRFETLKDQIEGYIRPKADGSLVVSDLYERVLERLENDCGVEIMRKVMTALWASRAGLTEPELLAITDLKHLQWAPIDLALEKAFGRNGNRLVFDHDYLRQAVEHRYLPTEGKQRQAHSELAESFLPSDSEFSIRIIHEYPWQLSRSHQQARLRAFMLDVYNFAFLAEVDGFSHIQDYLKAAECASGGTLVQTLQQEIIDYSDAMDKEGSIEAAEILLMTLNPISKILKQAGYGGQLLRTIRMACLKAARKSGIKKHIRIELFRWANYHLEEGEPAKAVELYIELIYKNHDAVGRAPEIIEIRQNMSLAYQKLGNPSKAIDMFKEALERRSRECNELNPGTILLMNNQAAAYCDNCEYEGAVIIYLECLESAKLILGSSDDLISSIYGGLGWAYQNLNRLSEARSCYLKSLSIAKQKGLLGRLPMISIYVRMGQLFRQSGKLFLARNMLSYCLRIRERELGLNHPDTNDVRKVLARAFSDLETYDESIPLRRQILAFPVKCDGLIAPSILTSIHELADDLYWTAELKESEQLYREALAGRIAALGDDDGATMSSRYGLARCLSEQERYGEAIELRRLELAWCQANGDVDAKDMLISMHGLGCDLLAAGETEEALEVLQSCLSQRQKELGAGDDETLATLARVLEALSSLDRQQEGLALSLAIQEALVAELGENHSEVITQLSNQASLHDELGELEQAEALYRRCLAGREDALGAQHPDTLTTAYNLAELLSQLERRAEAIPLRRRELTWCRQQNGNTDPGTLSSINELAIDLRETGALEEAEFLFRELVTTRQQVLEPGDFQIGRALGGLAKTFEDAGKLEEAAAYRLKALDHRLEHEGPDAWWSNRNRLDLARVLGKLGRDSEALAQLQELQQSMGRNDNPNDDDRELIIEAAELLRVTYGGQTPEA